MDSIRSYLTAILVATLCIVNFVAALNGYRQSMTLADESLDQRLSRITESIINLTAIGKYEVGSGNDSLLQIWRDNQLLNHSDSAPTTPLIEFKPGFHHVNYAGVQWRVHVQQDSSNGWIVYGERYDSYRKLIDKLVVSSILPIIWVLPIIALLVWLITGFGLRPLRNLAATLYKRDEHDLAPLPENSYPYELSHVVESVNRLFARLRQALDRERRFAANAAHELRTPIAVLKVNLHNHMKDLTEAVALDASNQPCHLAMLEDSVDRMEASIQQVLDLHQLTPENKIRTLKKCELMNLIQTVVLSLYSSVSAKHIDLELVGNAQHLYADPNALSIMIKNLLDNAVKHTPNGGRILISVVASPPGYVQIFVEDSGPGIPADAYEKVFDRFYQVVTSQPTSVRGSGLGLSIVKQVLDLHDGKIELSRSIDLGGLKVVVTIPLTQTNCSRDIQ